MSTSKWAARRVRTTTGTAKQTSPNAVYRNQADRAIPKLLAQAGDILCLLSLFSLGATERAGLVALLEHRLARAYGGSQ